MSRRVPPVNVLLVVLLTGAAAPKVSAGAAAAPAAPPPAEVAPAADRYRELVEGLKKRYPAREDVAEHAQQIAAELVGFAEEEFNAAGKPLAGKARILAAEVLFIGGGAQTARQLLAVVARRGLLAEDRAKALYLLGEHYFYRGKMAASRPAAASGGEAAQPSRSNAEYYWTILARRYPESPWAKRIERPLRYARLLDGGAAVEFRESFVLDGKEKTYSLGSLKGKVAVLDFWRSSSAGQKRFEMDFARDLAAACRQSPGIRAGLVVLGINLDRDRATFEKAVESWQIPWPQHHDGKAFQTPLAVAFAIPVEPLRVVLGRDGRILYMGREPKPFFRVLSREMDRLQEDERTKPARREAETGSGRGARAESETGTQPEAGARRPEAKAP